VTVFKRKVIHTVDVQIPGYGCLPLIITPDFSGDSQYWSLETSDERVMYGGDVGCLQQDDFGCYTFKDNYNGECFTEDEIKFLEDFFNENPPPTE
jgi:hypothetical protein